VVKVGFPFGAKLRGLLALAGQQVRHANAEKSGHVVPHHSELKVGRLDRRGGRELVPNKGNNVDFHFQDSFRLVIVTVVVTALSITIARMAAHCLGE
jgi:hypothetical protein